MIPTRGPRLRRVHYPCTTSTKPIVRPSSLPFDGKRDSRRISAFDGRRCPCTPVRADASMGRRPAEDVRRSDRACGHGDGEAVRRRSRARGGRGAGGGPGGGGPGVDPDRAGPALAREPRDGARARRRPSARRGRSRRRSPCSAGEVRVGLTGDELERAGRGAGAVPQGEPARPGLGRRAGARRGDDRLGDALARAAGGDRRDGHRRARRGPPRRGGDVRRLHRPRRAGPGRRRPGGLLGGQVDPRRAGHARGAGDARGGRRRLPDRRVPRLHHAGRAACRWRRGSTRPGEAAAVVAAHRALGLPGAVVLAQPVAGRRRARPRRDGGRAGRRDWPRPAPGASRARRSPRSCSTASARRPAAGASRPTPP